MNHLIDDVKKLLNRQLYGILATSGEASPHMNLIAFYASENLTHIMFFSPENSEKIYNINRNPGIALFVDNRTNTTEDIRSVTSVTVYGRASLPNEQENSPEWRADYNNKLPHMVGFADDPSNIPVRIDVKTIHVVRDLHDVTVLNIS